ncbi:MAG: hydroxymethylbilane synthase [Actinomycetota bacterium]|nr:hydroxymethylbilane synthase [Actinomycetota bacterium]
MTALRVGTRGSALALAQAGMVADSLPGQAVLVTITTAGDIRRDVGDKGRWVSALETALLCGEIDLAVHSAKDVPGELADGCVLAAAPERASALDVLVGFGSLRELPAGARVGTSALRRQAQLLATRPDLDVVELRGNVDTRLAKRAAGEVDALVLARAGLDRLGVKLDVPVCELDDELFVPAPGQGILALEARAGDEQALAAAGGVNHAPTFAALEAERAAVRSLNASCDTPVGAHAQPLDGGRFLLRGFAGMPDGSDWVLDEVQADSGQELARRMLAAGAGELLERAAAARA